MSLAIPKISVVMSVYNSFRYLRESIDSILNQTFIDFEFIIIDDCSTDDSYIILEEYSEIDERIIIIQNSINLGITKSLNKGLEKAKGEFVARMDADDVAIPERFSAQINYLLKHRDCVALGTEVLLIDPDGSPIGVKGQPTKHKDIIETSMSGYGGVIIHPSVMMRRSAVSKVGGYDPEFEVAQDLDLFIRLADVGKLSNLPHVYLKYRHHFDRTTDKRRVFQVETVRKIITNAWKKRGLGSPPENLSRVLEVISVEERRRRWIRDSLAQGYYRTARKHSIRLLLDKPLSRSAWKLALRAIKRTVLSWGNSRQSGTAIL